MTLHRACHVSMCRPCLGIEAPHPRATRFPRQRAVTASFPGTSSKQYLPSASSIITSNTPIPSTPTRISPDRPAPLPKPIHLTIPAHQAPPSSKATLNTPPTTALLFNGVVVLLSCLWRAPPEETGLVGREVERSGVGEAERGRGGGGETDRRRGGGERSVSAEGVQQASLGKKKCRPRVQAREPMILRITKTRNEDRSLERTQEMCRWEEHVYAAVIVRCK